MARLGASPASRSRLAASGLVVALAGAACVASTTPDVDRVVGIEVADGFVVEEVIDGLDQPTQVTHHPDGRLVVAELNGGENEANGRVVVVDPDGEEPPELLVDGLTKPTGVAVVGDEVWILEQRRLSRAPLTGTVGGSPSTVLDSLPFNGRSETTLTVTPDGHLLYATTGSLSGGRPVEGSGVLWELDPADSLADSPTDSTTGSPAGTADGNTVGVTPSPVSAGFKNAYGHTYGPDGRLWVTEISDGSFDGRSAPDELVEVTAGVDHGWPACIGDRTPVIEFGGDEATCGEGPATQALFAPGATPTSVAIAPWDPDTLVVALWVERRVVLVPADAVGIPHEPVDVVTGDLRPQHLLVDGDRLLVVDHDAGRILALSTAP